MKYRIFAMILPLTLITLLGCSQAPKSEPVTPPPAPDSVVVPPAAVKKSQAPEPTSVLCEYDDIRRELKIIQESDRCRVEYIKDGSTQEIATGTVGSTYCQEVLERVKNNLVAAGYKCK